MNEKLNLCNIHKDKCNFVKKIYRGLSIKFLNKLIVNQAAQDIEDMKKLLLNHALHSNNVEKLIDDISILYSNKIKIWQLNTMNIAFIKTIHGYIYCMFFSMLGFLTCELLKYLGR